MQIATPSGTSYNDVGLTPNTIYSYRVRAADAAGNLSSYSSRSSATTQDTIAPTISLTSPVNNATVAGTITLSASASDNVGVLGVQFKVDGVNVGAEDTTAPYSISWNTLSVADGSHIITAQARDAAANTTLSNGITVNVLNFPPPPFDFSLTNDGSKGIAQGGSVVSTLTATLVSGTAKNVSFSISGLPAGATAVYLPTNCLPSCSVSLTITAGATTPVGTQTLTASATDGTLIKTTTFTLTVTPPPSNKFKKNDRVQVVPSAVANSAPVYNAASISSTLLTTQPDGTLGMVVAGPVYADGYHWWQIDYDTSGGVGTNTDGWSVENALDIATFAIGAKFIPDVEGGVITSRNFTVDILQRTSSTTIFTLTLQPNAQGQLSLTPIESNLLEGTYNLLVKAPSYLRKLARDVVITSSANMSLPKLKGGDMNDDGIINSFDWSFMNNVWFGADLTADLNRDGVVNSIDFSFLNKNWGAMQD